MIRAATTTPALRPSVRFTARISAGCISALALTLAATGPAAADPTPTPSGGVDTSTLVSPSNDDAMLNLLGQQGVSYRPVTNVNEALRADWAATTLVIDADEVPSSADLTDVADAGYGRIIILNDDGETLHALAPTVTVVQRDWFTATPSVAPSCSQVDALAAGSIDLEGSTTTYSLPPDSSGTTCYPVNGAPSLIDVPAVNGNGDVIVLGSTAYFENQYLALAGNAALGLRLFGAHGTLVWWAPTFVSDPSLTNCIGPGCALLGGGGGGGGNGGGSASAQPQNGTTVTESPEPQASNSRATLTSMMPSWIWWALLQLVIAALLTAYWRARRLGRVVTEELPVAVRAAETVEGHARLYRRANAHGRAAELLRRATAGRLAGYFGIPAVRAHADPTLLVAPVAARLDVSRDLIGDLLVGGPPESEAELVLLADHLDQLEKEVRSS